MKKFYDEHRVFIILMGIVVICLFVITILLFKYFYFGSSKSAPKRTCADINAAVQSEITGDLETDKLISDAKLRVSDKSNNLFITITFNNEASLDEAKSKAVTAFEKFDDSAKECYDFGFILIQPEGEKNEGFCIMGAKNKSGTNFVWNNNNTNIDANED